MIHSLKPKVRAMGSLSHCPQFRITTAIPEVQGFFVRGLGEGLGDGLGDGLGEASGLGEGLADGLGEGLGLGLGVGLGV